MSYSTTEDVRNALAPTLAAANSTASGLTDEQIEDAIAEADGRIDSYIGARYVTPVLAVGLPPLVPSVIVYLSRDIAAYMATLTFRRSKDMTDQDPVYRRFAEAKASLIAVSKGQASLPIPENTGNAASQGAGQAINPYAGNLFVDRDFSLAAPRLGWDRWARREF